MSASDGRARADLIGAGPRPFAFELVSYWWARRRPRDAVSVLSIYLVLCFGVPSVLIITPIGGGGTPANLFGMGLLLWWIMAKVSGAPMARGRQPLRWGLLVFMLGVLASLINLYNRPSIPKESTGVLRGAMFLLGLCGVLLYAADGIPSIERAHVLMRRVIHWAAVVAAIGFIEFLTTINISDKIPYPLLHWNMELAGTSRSSFVRVRSTALHPIELGTFLGMMLPFAVQYAFMARGRVKRWSDDRPAWLERLWPRPAVLPEPVPRAPYQGRSKVLAWVEVGMIGAVLPMALSRSGVIALVIGSIGLFMNWTWSRRLKGLGVALVFLAAMRVAVPGLLGSLLALFFKISEDNSTTARTGRYGIAGDLFFEYPWLGRGYNTLFPVTQQIFDNAYLYAVTETGLVGLFTLIAFLVVYLGICRGFRLRTADPDLQALSNSFSASAVTMIFLFSSADMMSFTMLMQCFFLFGGVAATFWRLTGGPERAVLPRSVRKPRAPAPPRATPAAAGAGFRP